MSDGLRQSTTHDNLLIGGYLIGGYMIVGAFTVKYDKLELMFSGVHGDSVAMTSPAGNVQSTKLWTNAMQNYE